MCHTELDEIEGRATPPEFPVVLGHEIVGRAVCLGVGARKHREGGRARVGWIYSSSRGRDEYLSPEFRATGRDANGGYAEYMTVPEDYAYAIPPVFSDEHAAPLLCAGAIGFRSLGLTNIRDGYLLGLAGFGGSAHLVLKLVRHRFPNTNVYVFTRDMSVRKFALELGAVWTGDITERSPKQLHAIIDTTPVWRPVVEALNSLRPGGRLVINAICKEDVDKDSLLNLSYREHLWLEREIKTVANITRYDIQEFLPIAAKISLKPEVTTYKLEEANQSLIEFKRGGTKGAKVLVMS